MSMRTRGVLEAAGDDGGGGAGDVDAAGGDAASAKGAAHDVATRIKNSVPRATDRERRICITAEDSRDARAGRDWRRRCGSPIVDQHVTVPADFSYMPSACPVSAPVNNDIYGGGTFAGRGAVLSNGARTWRGSTTAAAETSARTSFFHAEGTRTAHAASFCAFRASSTVAVRTDRVRGSADLRRLRRSSSRLGGSMNRFVVFGAISCLAALTSLSAACSSTTTSTGNDDAGSGGGNDSGGGTDAGTAQDTGGGTQDSGIAQDTGTGTETGGGDQACAAATTNAACRTCCTTNHPGGSAALQSAQIACVCKAGECDSAQTCGATLCANPPKNPDQACLTCANNKALSPDSGTSCYQDVVTACQNSAPCLGYVTCLGNSSCASKP
jgi:hypothetical protein